MFAHFHSVTTSLSGNCHSFHVFTCTSVSIKSPNVKQWSLSYGCGSRLVCGHLVLFHWCSGAEDRAFIVPLSTCEGKLSPRGTIDLVGKWNRCLQPGMPVTCWLTCDVNMYIYYLPCITLLSRCLQRILQTSKDHQHWILDLTCFSTVVQLRVAPAISIHAWWNLCVQVATGGTRTQIVLCTIHCTATPAPVKQSYYGMA